jgi:ArsR family transcriptional regulator, arsenate/arsenite/antimonite-responsive transcriptional repressor / arsenate reductase (thioredoxin)
LETLQARAAIHAALGEPVRLALVERLVSADASPSDLAADLRLGTNLLAHHLRVLEQAGVVRRLRSEGDRRRSYVQLRLDSPTVLAALPDQLGAGPPRRVLFVCSANSARSQLAAAAWRSLSAVPATSAGTHPAARVHRRAIAVAARHGLDLSEAVPAGLDSRLDEADLIVAVCDNVHEALDPALRRLHWSVPDPARIDTDTAFETAFADINGRVHNLAARQNAVGEWGP